MKTLCQSILGLACLIHGINGAEPFDYHSIRGKQAVATETSGKQEGEALPLKVRYRSACVRRGVNVCLSGPTGIYKTTAGLGLCAVAVDFAFLGTRIPVYNRKSWTGVDEANDRIALFEWLGVLEEFCETLLPLLTRKGQRSQGYDARLHQNPLQGDAGGLVYDANSLAQVGIVK